LHSSAASESDFNLPLGDADAGGTREPEKLRAFPAPSNTTDASIQLARQVSRLLSDARRQIHAAAREAAEEAVSAERRANADPWEQKIAVAREEFSREVAAAVARIQEESAAQSRDAQVTALEALQRDLPRWLAPQLEELTRDLTAELTQEALSQRNAHAEQINQAAEMLRAVCLRRKRAAKPVCALEILAQRGSAYGAIVPSPGWKIYGAISNSLCADWERHRLLQSSPFL